MKHLAILLLGFIVTAAQANTIRLSEPVAQSAQAETFGKVQDKNLPKISLSELSMQAEKHVGKNLSLKTKVAKVCQKKGCFFIAQENEHVMRVSFKDYGFFIPTDASNKIVTMSGQVIKKQRSPEQAQHFKDDLKTDSSALNAGIVYEFVADSVEIPKA